MLRAIFLTVLIVFGLAQSTGIADEETGAPKQPWTESFAITEPYARGEMPTARELLDMCWARLADSGAWRADIELQTIQAEPLRRDSLRGKLSANGRRLRVDLVSSRRDRGAHLLVVTDSEGVLWSEERIGREILVRKRSLAKGEAATIAASENAALSALSLFADNPKQLQSWLDERGVENRGAAKVDGQTVYVLSTPFGQDSTDRSQEQRQDDTIVTIVMSADRSLPVLIGVATPDQSTSTLTCGSYDFDARVDDELFVYTPPPGAEVVDLDMPMTAGKDEPITNPIAYTPESIARGKRLYLSDCVVCHSFDGTGRDSDVTDNAADLTDSEYWLSDGSDGATFLAIRDGAGDEMPGYKDDYRDEKMIWDLVNYIESLQKAK